MRLDRGRAQVDPAADLGCRRIDVVAAPAVVRVAAVVVVPFSDVDEDRLVAAVEELRDRLSSLEADGLETRGM